MNKTQVDINIKMMPCYTAVFIPAGTSVTPATNLPFNGENRYWVFDGAVPGSLRSIGILLTESEVIKGVN